MRRILFVLALAGCHTQQIGRADKAPEAVKKDEQKPESKEVHVTINSGRPVRPTPHGYLSHDAIVKIQHALSAKGEDVEATGKLDRETTAALKRFQKANHQPDTGYPDFGTLDSLGLEATKLYGGKPDKETGAAGIVK